MNSTLFHKRFSLKTSYLATMRILIYTLLAVLTVSCASRTNVNTSKMVDGRSKSNMVERKAKPTATNLTDYLRRISGVTVSGEGANARVQVRGPVSFQQSSNRPLFIVNGSQLGTDYSTVFNNIDVREIQSVRVLKGADETAVYGMQGSAGVILIRLRDR